MTCLSMLLTASAVIAASLLGGCSDNAIGTAGGDTRAVAAVAQKPLPPQTTSRQVGERLASLALDDSRLGKIRGGMDAGPGVVLNFAFQQATFVNHNLAETVVVPTLTIAAGQATGLASSSFGVLGVTNASNATVTPSVTSATVVANGTVETQVSVSAPVLQALVNSGLASVVGAGATGGVTSVLTNAQNNALVQQVTNVDIGVNGLSKLMQQSIPSTVLNQLGRANAFR